MKTNIRILCAMLAMALVTPIAKAQTSRQSQPFKLHNIFGSGMVLQRDKPIKVWGWAKPGSKVTVTLGKESAEATTAAAAPVDVFGYEEAYKGLGKWEVSFPARPASTDPITLTAASGGETITLDNVLLGDVWVMSGQSNMAFGVGGTDAKYLLAQANIPMLRLLSITGNEQASLQHDIRPEAIDTISKSWDVSSPETAEKFSAIGFAFAAEVQRSLGIPIGVIKSARGGASLESMVPAQKFDEHPLSKRYADLIRKRMAEFNPDALLDQEWAKLKEQAKAKGQPEPPRPQPKPLRSWNVPGKSPSDMASVHNGYFGVFKGYNIKGVLFHQGFNNTLGDNCRPKRYRLLIKLMVEGWREDFSDPKLPVCIIGGCGGSTAQNESNFELLSVETGPFIREAQRLGLDDVGDPENTEFIPDYDVRIPGLHPTKKRQHGHRAALWALSHIYQVPNVSWATPTIPKVEANGDMMIVRFAEKQRAQPDDGSETLEGFSVAGEDGKFYMAYGRYLPVKEKDKWTKDTQTVQVWSPMVEKPVALRYAWATAAMGNLKLNGDQEIPFPGFRTDTWDLPESEDPTASSIGRGWWNEQKAEAQARFEARRLKEADMGRKLLERLDQMSAPGK
ncbi:MAG TPA: sialate O-acetylesterase [Luteolibacter sp.]|nr:sialate O-acetylesterase [Luteolibacter sp.]